MSFESNRTGLRVRVESGTIPEVRSAILNFAKWLRLNYDFPIRLPIYVKKAKQIKSMSGEMVFGTFFAPYDKTIEPYIRLATGDYWDDRYEWGRDEALASILHTLAHEIVHYQQWLKDKDLDCRNSRLRATKMLKAYANTREHP